MQEPLYKPPSSKTVAAGFFRKMAGGLEPVPSVPVREALTSGIGGLLAIALVSWLSVASGVPWMMAPLGGSCVLAFAAHNSPFAQPRSIVGGHLIATAIGILAAKGLGPTWWAMALCVGLSISAMMLTRTVHPPAGANPIIVLSADTDWMFLVQPVLLGSIAMVVAALLFNNLVRERQYPRYW